MVNRKRSDHKFSLVLPVLFYEYLAISITKSLLPKMIVDYYGDWSYLAVGMIETAKGCLAFLSCPIFGRLSDRIGRKYCLLVTVIGTTLPVCMMAFTDNMIVYAVMMSLSGFFSATFPLTFAYISDCVTDRKKRAPAFGLALATFGLSFCIGPVTGSYLAKQFGEKCVFIFSFVLVLINVLYIVLFLPETVKVQIPANSTIHVALEYLPHTWDFEETFRTFRSDSFMTNLSIIVFLYYTAVWSLVSTLIIHVTRHLGFSSLALGWLLSSYGLATMFSEGVLVRCIVPYLGEINSMRLGLLAFSAQCVVVAFSSSPTWIFVSILFSMLANLVYPSMSSLVSKVVDEDSQGEALGALNGIKALTEGFGPLTFGLLMGLFERTPVPGAPYLLACILSLWAFLHCFELPPEPEQVVAKFKSRDTEEGEALLQMPYPEVERAKRSLEEKGFMGQDELQVEVEVEEDLRL